LVALARHRGSPRGIVLRIEIVLGAAQGMANRVLARKPSTSVPTVLLWRKRFESDGTLGFSKAAPEADAPSGSPQSRKPPSWRPPCGRPRKTPRNGACALGVAQKVSSATVQRIGQCQPRHRHQEFLRFLDRIEEAVDADVDVHLFWITTEPTSIPRQRSGIVLGQGLTQPEDCGDILVPTFTHDEDAATPVHRVASSSFFPTRAYWGQRRFLRADGGNRMRSISPGDPRHPVFRECSARGFSLFLTETNNPLTARGPHLEE
jgi:hypothetical protein